MKNVSVIKKGYTAVLDDASFIGNIVFHENGQLVVGSKKDITKQIKGEFDREEREGIAIVPVTIFSNGTFNCDGYIYKTSSIK